MIKGEFYPLELKSTGFLIDEWLTAGIKSRHTGKQEDKAREHKLAVIIQDRTKEYTDFGELDKLIAKLRLVLKRCWDNQESVMQYHYLVSEQNEFDIGEYASCAFNAIHAQKYNAERNKLIREIDEYLGESDNSVLGKTYA